MKRNIFTLILCSAIILSLGNSATADFFHYETEDHILTSSNYIVDWNQNNTIHTFSVETTGDQTLYVWVDEMECEKLTGQLPNYLFFEIETTAEVNATREDLCELVKDEKISVFPEGITNLASTKVKITPVGDWTDQSNRAVIRFQVVEPKIKQFQLEDEMTHLDLTFRSTQFEQHYEITFDPTSDYCSPPANSHEDDNKPISSDCILNMVVNKMNCSKNEESTGAEIQVETKTGINDTFPLCEHLSNFNSHRATKKYFAFESAKSIVFKSYGKLETTVSITPQLRSTYSNADNLKCPDGYFNCYSARYCNPSNSSIARPTNMTSCILEELACDSRPHCPVECPDADENKDYCKAKLGYDDDCDDFTYDEYWYYYGNFNIWQSIFAFVFFVAGITTIGFVFRALYTRYYQGNSHPRRRPTTSSTPTVSDEVRKARMAPPPTYGEATAAATYP